MKPIRNGTTHNSHGQAIMNGYAAISCEPFDNTIFAKQEQMK